MIGVVGSVGGVVGPVGGVVGPVGGVVGSVGGVVGSVGGVVVGGAVVGGVVVVVVVCGGLHAFHVPPSLNGKPGSVTFTAHVWSTVSLQGKFWFRPPEKGVVVPSIVTVIGVFAGYCSTRTVSPVHEGFARAVCADARPGVTSTPIAASAPVPASIPRTS